MSDIQKCTECSKEFDFDKKGFGMGGIIVCSSNCAKKSAKRRGHKYAIHDKKDNIVNTNADGSEKVHYF